MMKSAAAAGTRSPATDLETVTGTLAGEHELLLREVRLRAGAVLARLRTRGRPQAELRTLTGFLRTAVLRQASDEEALLYPGGGSAPVAELTAEHAELHAITEQLDRAAATPSDVAQLIDRMLRVLEHHLIQEQALLEALPDAPDPIPAAADLVAGTQSWPHPDEEPVLILLDALPQEDAVQICIERLLRLRPGQSAEIHSGQENALQQVCRWIHDFDSTRYAIARPPSGPVRPALQVTRRTDPAGRPFALAPARLEATHEPS